MCSNQFKVGKLKASTSLGEKEKVREGKTWQRKNRMRGKK